jgi:hypothetical protein
LGTKRTGRFRAQLRGLKEAFVAQTSSGQNSPLKRGLGDFGDVGGPSDEWANRVTLRVSNYGEASEQDFGPRTPFQMDRRCGKVARGLALFLQA